MRVLLTNCTHNAGIVVARALTRAGHEVVGADDARMPLGLRSRYLRRQHVVPAEDDGALGDALCALLLGEKPDVLVPFSGVAAVAARRAELGALAAFLVPDARALEDVVDKAALPAICAAHGIDTPRVYGRTDAIAQLRGDDTTLVVKPRRGRGGGAGIRFVSSAEALEQACDAIEGGGGSAVVCELIPGTTADERALHLLLDRESRLVAAFSLQKCAQSPPQVGITAAAVSTRDGELVERVLPLLRALRWQGPLDVEWKLDPRDGRVKLIEINPRFSGAIGFPIALGVDFPVLYAAASTGTRLPEATLSEYPAGARYLNPGPYLAALPARARTDGWSRTLAGVRTECLGRAVIPAFELTDPAPIAGKALRALLALLPVPRPAFKARARREDGR